MKKLVFTLFAASSLIFTNSAVDVEAAFNSNTITPAIESSHTAQVNTGEVEQVAAAKATVKTGKYKTKHNSNIRLDAGTKYKVVTVAKKGATVIATHQKKVGSKTWYKVKVNGKAGWVLSTLLTPASTKVVKASNSASSSEVVSIALSLKGIPYKFGGTTTSGFDCSGFIQYVFKKAGKNVSRTTGTQFAESTTVSNPVPGDLIFFANTYKAGISHVGIYIGNGQFVHAGGSKAEVKSVNDPYWGKKFHSYKRL
ncbi:C40 family peptidase [Planococcus sp. 1R117A]|uniref:C40 family peptidase n=1 Tax=Planococcus sp. 1R117A TaxID=3447020 RepID=UPI003EDC101B